MATAKKTETNKEEKKTETIENSLASDASNESVVEAQQAAEAAVVEAIKNMSID